MAGEEGVDELRGGGIVGGRGLPADVCMRIGERREIGLGERLQLQQRSVTESSEKGSEVPAFSPGSRVDARPYKRDVCAAGVGSADQFLGTRQVRTDPTAAGAPLTGVRAIGAVTGEVRRKD